MNILLRSDNSQNYKLLISSNPEDSFNELLKYLDRCGIAYVDTIPEKNGLFCVPDKNDRYNIYQTVFNKEDNMYDSYLIYSLQWLFFYNKNVDFEKLKIDYDQFLEELKKAQELKKAEEDKKMLDL